MLKRIDYKRNNKTEVIKINLKKINYIYGANGTGKTTTSTGYANLFHLELMLHFQILYIAFLT